LKLNWTPYCFLESEIWWFGTVKGGKYWKIIISTRRPGASPWILGTNFRKMLFYLFWSVFSFLLTQSKAFSGIVKRIVGILGYFNISLEPKKYNILKILSTVNFIFRSKLVIKLKIFDLNWMGMLKSVELVWLFFNLTLTVDLFVLLLFQSEGSHLSVYETDRSVCWKVCPCLVRNKAQNS
jgi:hypothetical protein